MKRIAAAVSMGAVLAVCAAVMGQSAGLPTLEQSVDFIEYAAVCEVVEAQKFEGKEPWQIVKYKLVKTLKGKFKDKEFELYYIQSVSGSQGYGLPLPEKFVEKGAKVVLFFEKWTDKDGKEKLRAATPDPHTFDLSATDELLKKVGELVEKWEKDEKELEKQRKKKTHVNKSPAFKITKAGDDWLIVDMEKQKEEMLKRAGSPQEKQNIEKMYAEQPCRIFNQKAKATLQVHSKKAESNVRIDDARQWVEDDLKNNHPGATMTSAKPVTCCGEKGWGFKYEVTSADGKMKTNYERYIFVRKGYLYDMRMWCPAEEYDKMQKDFAKMVGSFKF
jgi:hypothetical protein